MKSSLESRLPSDHSNPNILFGIEGRDLTHNDAMTNLVAMQQYWVQTGINHLKPNSRFRAPYSEIYLDYFVDIPCLDSEERDTELEAFLAPVSGRVVFDLGSGANDFALRYLSELEIPRKPLAYVGLDLFHHDRVVNKRNRTDSIFGGRMSYEDDYSLPSVAIEGDMLTVVSSMPSPVDNIGPEPAFMLNGIDDSILRYQQYTNELAKELTRVTPVGSGIIGISLGSTLTDQLKSSSEFEVNGDFM